VGIFSDIEKSSSLVWEEQHLRVQLSGESFHAKNSRSKPVPCHPDELPDFYFILGLSILSLCIRYALGDRTVYVLLMT
jgi:hypothetical protein